MLYHPVPVSRLWLCLCLAQLLLAAHLPRAAPLPIVPYLERSSLTHYSQIPFNLIPALCL